MVNRKAQGISITFIVVAAIAALVLVLVVMFTMGGLGNFFGRIMGSAELIDADITDARVTCESYCNDARLGGYGVWSTSSYCIARFPIDIDGDGVIDPDREMLSCYSPEINVRCLLNTADSLGESISCTYADCPTAGDPARRCCGTGCSGADTFDCDDLTTQASCISVNGCTWASNACSGTPANTACNSLGRIACIEASVAGSCEYWKQLEWSGTVCE